MAKETTKTTGDVGDAWDAWAKSVDEKFAALAADLEKVSAEAAKLTGMIAEYENRIVSLEGVRAVSAGEDVAGKLAEIERRTENAEKIARHAEQSMLNAAETVSTVDARISGVERQIGLYKPVETPELVGDGVTDNTDALNAARDDGQTEFPLEPLPDDVEPVDEKDDGA